VAEPTTAAAATAAGLVASNASSVESAATAVDALPAMLVVERENAGAVSSIVDGMGVTWIVIV
jgi:hypothetical protein